MAIFEVDLFEGNNLVTYRVEADNEQQADQIARQKREEIFQQENTQESLQREKEQIQGRLASAESPVALATKTGLQQSGANISAGLADATLGIAQGVTDAAAWAGMDSAARASEALQERRNSVKDFSREVTLSAMSKLAGRPLTEAERQKAAQEADSERGLAKLASEMALTAGAGSVALRASTMPRMLLVGTTEGALSGWLVGGSKDDIKQRQAERLGTASFGAVVGLGASLIPGAFAGAKNWLVRKVNKAAGGNILAKQAALKEAGISAPVTVGQMTGDPNFLAVEAQASGAIADDLFRQQQQEVAGNLARKIGIRLPSMNEMTSGTRKIVREGMKRASQALGQMRGARNKAFEQGLDAVEAATGSKPIIRFDGVTDTVNDQLAGVMENYRNVSFSSNFKTLLADLDDAVKNGATPKRANSILLRLNQIKGSGSGIFNEADEVVKGSIDTYKGHSQKIAASIKRAVEEAFDQSANRIGGAAGQQLKSLRTNYAKASEEIGVLEDELMGALGMKGDVADILRRLGSADDEAVSTAMRALRQLPGGIDFHNKLLTGVYRQSVNDASAAALGFGEKAGNFNLRAFVRALGKNAEQSKFKGFLTVDQEKNLVKGMDAIRTLLNDPRVASNQGVLKTFLPVDLQGIAINALSRDPGFMARLVAQGLQRGKGAESLFFTKEGIDLLTGATKSVVVGKNSGAVAGTIIPILAAMLGTGIAEETGAELIAQMEQQKQAASQ